MEASKPYTSAGKLYTSAHKLYTAAKKLYTSAGKLHISAGRLYTSGGWGRFRGQSDFRMRLVQVVVRPLSTFPSVAGLMNQTPTMDLSLRV